METKKVPSPNTLEQLKAFTTVVADTGDFKAIKEYKPEDATTNPLLILQAATLAQYKPIIQKAVDYGYKTGKTLDEKVENAIDMLSVSFGLEILKMVPGRVSIEADARLSFDTEGSVNKSRKLIQLFEDNDIDRERVMIKLASTWEGIQAAKILESKYDIRCNLTLLFNTVQAAAGAEAGATLISPYVAQILDWDLPDKHNLAYPAEQDPGIKNVKEIFTYYKKFGYETQIMAASLLNMDVVLALAGLDLLTIPPAVLAELKASKRPVVPQLSAEAAKKAPLEKLHLTEAKFRWLMNEDEMATDNIARGIRRFAAETVKLQNIVRQLIVAK